jgi:hypothetical protein
MNPDKQFRKSYNKQIKQVRFKRANLDKDNWHTIFIPVKNAKIMMEHNVSPDLRFKLYPYRPYFLWSLWWLMPRLSKKSQVFMQNKYIKYAIVAFIIPVAVTVIAAIIYDKYFK